MPQAPSHLRVMFEDDSAAWAVLAENFRDDRGMIRPKVKGYRATAQEDCAIDYLWLEWDYGYEV